MTYTDRVAAELRNGCTHNGWPCYCQVGLSIALRRPVAELFPTTDQEDPVTTPRLVFIDTETTSLRHDRRAWEVALIVRDPDTGKDEEYTWFVDTDDLDLGNADLMSLKIGKFYDRHPQALNPTAGRRYDSLHNTVCECDALMEVERMTRGVILVGAVPNFDSEVLGNRMREHGICPSWHYHLIDVETLAAGALKLPPPWNFDMVLAEYGLTYDEADRHTALGDTRMVRDLYDAVMATDPEQLREMATRLLTQANEAEAGR